MSENNRIDLVELPTESTDELAAGRDFFSRVFGWSFTEWGGEYVDTEDSGVASALNAGDPETRPAAPLAVIYVEDLDATRDEIVDGGGTITVDTYPFPGGRRFHFTDPTGNELAVWSE